ncbi:hypothetical protein F0P96_11685 [Hymenobacter busanensis]|uniref:Uncharacterized protein n=1 Tax=Hymenobacter busanensis TaxID=2607656 RepID=A0A7L4ZWC8_9BACT|nr:hypothetical protein [Hymenobacter busanensis]KAA9332143.1 hypothetical protein F0P96_11685 [Hymenobacter busanensis]QHJ07518.1 hypothetical protein GUY19_09585 [Hymenobacter busanensis]
MQNALKTLVFLAGTAAATLFTGCAGGYATVGPPPVVVRPAPVVVVPARPHYRAYRPYYGPRYYRPAPRRHGRVIVVH